jgi:hypothetical protein
MVALNRIPATTDIYKRAQVGAATADSPSTTRLAAIVVERRDPNEGSDLLAVQRPELRQLSNDAADQNGSNTGH